MNVQPDRPFRDYPDLLTALDKHGIIHNNEMLDKQWLKEFGYYNLVNGYQSGLTIPNSHEIFQKGTSIEALVLLRTFDETLAGILFPLITHFENTLETAISYVISKHFGVFDVPFPFEPGYLAKANYKAPNMRPGRVLKRLREISTGYKDGNIESGNKIFSHPSTALCKYRSEHNHVPPWILAHELTLGELCLWYAICSPEIKKEICNELIPDNTHVQEGVREEFLSSSLNILTSYRNTIAHGVSLGKVEVMKDEKSEGIQKSVVRIIDDPSIISDKDYRLHIGQDDFFALLLIFAVFTHGYFLFEPTINSVLLITNAIEKIRPIGHQAARSVFRIPPRFPDRCKRLIEFYQKKK
ncbi:MAG: Abi family protein [Schleiferilactobacillus perolens]|uniref:Abi family protein n=1 Tax=Schleiferilactobacillus perolens TaxID=100468 RepID=UPI0039ED0EAC